MTLVLTPLSGLPLIQPGDDLPGLIAQALDRTGVSLQDEDILVLAQKVVSKAERRSVNLATIAPSGHAQKLAASTGKDPRLVELILRESEEVLRARPGLLIVRHRLGFVCANAGIDHSNVPPQGEGMGSEDEWVLLLPDDPDGSASSFRSYLETCYGVRLGVMIIDSHGRPWREGTVGMAIGLSGMPAVEDLRGKPDLFGYRLRITQVGVADELAAAASLVMGQAAEGFPVVHVRGFPYPLREATWDELRRPKDRDLFH